MASDQLRPDTAAAAPDDSLQSWKEIAAYLRRDVRTVQRWEKSEGLPVHRHWHRRLGSVFAHKVELDAWWNNHRVALESQNGGSELSASEAIEGAERADYPAQPEKAPRFWPVRAGLMLTALGVGLTMAWALLLGPKWSVQRAQLPDNRILATIEGIAAESWAGHRVLAADVNGDGLADAAIGVASARGSPSILFGASVRGNLSLARQAGVLIQEAHGHELPLMGTADINGDGLADLVLRENLPEPVQFGKTGEVFVVFGRKDWSGRMSLPADADVRISFRVSYHAGLAETAVSRRTDLNQDGIDELIFSANDFSPLQRASAGGVFVFWGRRRWPAELEATRQADVVIWGAEKGEGLNGVAVGDINGDGRNDLVISAADNSLWGMRQHRGRVYAFLGRKSMPRKLDAATDYDVRIQGAEPFDGFHRLALGDLNGDGLQDVVIGAPRGGLPPRPGAVFVYYGRRNWPRNIPPLQVDWKLYDRQLGGGFGHAVASRDTNGDGIDDLLVCRQSSHRGELSVYYGDASRRGATSSDAAEFVLRSNDPKDDLCTERPAVGDFDGNQTPEFLVGAPSAAVGGQANVGKAYVFSPFRPIQIDIRPGGHPNTVWPGSGRVLCVGVPKQEGFDPDAIDTASIRFAGCRPAFVNHCAVGSQSALGLCAFFDSANVKLGPADRVGVFTGRTRDGTPVMGVDSVLVLSEPASRPR